MNVLDARNSDHITDDSLFDLDLLNEMCYGLDDTFQLKLESQNNITRNNRKSSDLFKKTPLKLKITLDQPQHSSFVSSYGRLLETSLDQMWSELNDISQEPESHEMVSKKIRFPEQLRLILDQDQHSQIMSWQRDGKSFAIHDQSEFQNDILPLYFETSRWKSFQKQLNIYGFQQVDRRKKIYHHKHFIKGDPHSMQLMKREKIWPRYKKSKTTEAKTCNL